MVNLLIIAIMKAINLVNCDYKSLVICSFKVLISDSKLDHVAQV